MQNFLIFGFGLMGSSFAGLIKDRISSSNISVFDPNSSNISFGMDNGLIDNEFDPNSKINIDFVVICSPLSSYGKINDIITSSNSSFTHIFDLGSLNSYPYSIFSDSNFVSCHPICGSHTSGVAGYNPSMYNNADFVISRGSDNSNSLKKVGELVSELGMNIKYLSPDNHDNIYALVSHLPQFLSFLTKDYATNGLSDSFSSIFRLNYSPSDIWTDIFSFNEDNMRPFYEDFFNNLIDIYENIAEDKYEYILASLMIENTSLNDTKAINADLSDLSSKEVSFLLFRLTIALAYVRINKVEDYRSFAGSGFSDFTSIVSWAGNIEKDKLVKLFFRSKDELLQFFNEISI